MYLVWGIFSFCWGGYFSLHSEHYCNSKKEKAYGITLVGFGPLSLLPCLAAPLLPCWVWANKKADWLWARGTQIVLYTWFLRFSALHLYSIGSLCLTGKDNLFHLVEEKEWESCETKHAKNGSISTYRLTMISSFFFFLSRKIMTR